MSMDPTVKVLAYCNTPRQTPSHPPSAAPHRSPQRAPGHQEPPKSRPECRARSLRYPEPLYTEFTSSMNQRKSAPLSSIVHEDMHSRTRMHSCACSRSSSWGSRFFVLLPQCSIRNGVISPTNTPCTVGQQTKDTFDNPILPSPT
jgi:hypothetical protein